MMSRVDQHATSNEVREEEGKDDRDGAILFPRSRPSSRFATSSQSLLFWIIDERSRLSVVLT